MSMDVMIDLETLGTSPSAAVAQIGAVMFEPRSGGKVLNDRGFRQAVSEPVGEVEGSTLSWWLRQRNAAELGSAMSRDNGGRLLSEALVALLSWPRDAGYEWDDVGCVWAKPANFDLPILDSAFRACGLAAPWQHWATRCARTLFACVKHVPDVDRTGFVQHDALDDAVVQAMQVQKALGVLG